MTHIKWQGPGSPCCEYCGSLLRLLEQEGLPTVEVCSELYMRMSDEEFVKHTWRVVPESEAANEHES